MDISQILELLQTILTIVLGGLVLYFKFSTKAQTKAKQIQEKIAEITALAVVYIQEAENQYNDWTGGDKFQYVVNQLYDLVPDTLHVIITRDMIEEIVQSTFNEVKKYMTAKLDQAVDKVEVDTTEKEETVE